MRLIDSDQFSWNRYKAADEYLYALKPYWKVLSDTVTVVPFQEEPVGDARYGATVTIDESGTIYADAIFVRLAPIAVIAGAIEHCYHRMVRRVHKRITPLQGSPDKDKFAEIAFALEINTALGRENGNIGMETVRHIVDRSDHFPLEFMDKWQIDRTPYLENDLTWFPESLGLPEGLKAEQYYEMIVRSKQSLDQQRSDPPEQDEQESSENDVDSQEQQEQDPHQEDELKDEYQDRDANQETSQETEASDTGNTEDQAPQEEQEAESSEYQDPEQSETDRQLPDDESEHESDEDGDETNGDEPESNSDYQVDDSDSQQDSESQESDDQEPEQGDSEQPQDDFQEPDGEDDDDDWLSEEEGQALAENQGDEGSESDQQGESQEDVQDDFDDQLDEVDSSVAEKIEELSGENQAMDWATSSIQEAEAGADDIVDAPDMTDMILSDFASNQMMESVSSSISDSSSGSQWGTTPMMRPTDELLDFAIQLQKHRGTHWTNRLLKMITVMAQTTKIKGASDLSYSVRNPNQPAIGPVLMGLHDYAPSLALMIDRSGSMDHFLSMVMETFQEIMDACRNIFGQAMSWITVDTRIIDMGSAMSLNDSLQKKIRYQGGGTVLGPTIIDMATKSQIKFEDKTLQKPDVLIIVTDCQFLWPWLKASASPFPPAIIVASTIPYREAKQWLPRWVKDGKNFVYVGGPA